MAHNNLGVCLADQGHIEEAIEHYHKAIRIDPNYYEAMNNLGIALAAKGDLMKRSRTFARPFRPIQIALKR